MGETWHREPGTGRYARLERERRWLLDRVPDGVTRPIEIVDRYVTGTRLRLRRMSDADVSVFKLAQKVRVDRTDPSAVMLTNIYLSAGEYERLHALPGLELRKTRYALRRLAVDRFQGALDGLVLAEAEAETETEGDVASDPPFPVAEVTHDDRFSGGRLAATTADQLRTLLAEVR